MTDEELDQARADEAYRLYSEGKCMNYAKTAARLAREGWMPVDPLVGVISAALRDGSPFYEEGSHDYTSEAKVIVKALTKRGYVIKKEHLK